MKKWWIAGLLLLLIGLAMMAYQVWEKGRQLANVPEPEVAEPAKPVEELPRPAEPTSGAGIVVPPAPDSDPGELNPPRLLPFASAQGPADAASLPKLRREGTRLANLIGIVRLVGTRTEFVPADGSTSMILLENQVLQRIEALQAAPEATKSSPRWQVSGLVTEYRGINFLLLDRAVLAPQ